MAKARRAMPPEVAALSPEPVYFQVMLGRRCPEAMGYADDELYRQREAHLGRP